MQLGIGSYTYPWAIGVSDLLPKHPLTALELMDKACAIGISVVQYNDNLPLDRLSSIEIDVLAGHAEDFGAEIEVGTRGIDSSGLLGYLRLAVRLGSKFVRVVIDHAGHTPSVAEVIEQLRPVVRRYADAGIVLAIENHDRFPSDDLITIVETLGPANVGICLDTVNSIGALEMPTETVRKLAPYTVNLHIKDFEVERIESQMGLTITGRPAGDGRLDIPWILDHVNEYNPDVNAIIEIWSPFLGSVSCTVDRENAWAKQSIDYLRQQMPGSRLMRKKYNEEA